MLTCATSTGLLESFSVEALLFFFFGEEIDPVGLFTSIKEEGGTL